jgi:tRNA(Ile2) C34 agmatinyltransferase TiaS
MSAALAAPAPPAATRPAASTLERRLEAVLAEAAEHGHAECPVCGHGMTAAGDLRELVCGACDARLS